jgi:hypothetical protein
LVVVAAAAGIGFSLTALCAVAITALSIATTFGYAGPEPKNATNVTEAFGVYSLVAAASAFGAWFLFRRLLGREATRSP